MPARCAHPLVETFQTVGATPAVGRLESRVDGLTPLADLRYAMRMLSCVLFRPWEIGTSTNSGEQNCEENSTATGQKYSAAASRSRTIGPGTSSLQQRSLGGKHVLSCRAPWHRSNHKESTGKCRTRNRADGDELQKHFGSGGLDPEGPGCRPDFLLGHLTLRPVQRSLPHVLFRPVPGARIHRLRPAAIRRAFRNPGNRGKNALVVPTAVSLDAPGSPKAKQQSRNRGADWPSLAQPRPRICVKKSANRQDFRSIWQRKLAL